MTYDPRQMEMGQKRSLARGRVEYFRVQLGEGDPTEKTNEKHRDMGKDLGVCLRGSTSSRDMGLF